MTLPTSYFDDLYAASRDPWRFVDRWYEQRKRALTLALLPDAHYASAYEPGCSIGILTRELAPRCDRLLATDASAAAVADARCRCGDLTQVTVECSALPAGWPPGTFDLVLLSELGYYLGGPDLRAMADLAMRAGRTVVAVHWRHPVADYPQPGDEVHRVLGAAADRGGLRRLGRHEDDDILAEVWSADGRSVATREGLT